MEVILAKSSGFCFGVKRAVDKVYEQTDKDKKIYTYDASVLSGFTIVGVSIHTLSINPNIIAKATTNGYCK